MRILTVSAFYESHGGGIEVVAGALARALARAGHECRWAAAGFDQAPEDPLLWPVPLPASDPIERWTGLPMPVPSRSARVALRREIAASDAVIVHDALYLSSLLAARYARAQRKPWLLVQHIGAIPYTNPLLRAAMTAANALVARPLVRRAPEVVFISNAVREFFAPALKADRHRLLFNGVDARLFRPPTGVQRRQLRKRLGLSSERRQLLFVGRFVEKKGLATLRALATKRPGWDFLMAGAGPLDPAAWGLPNLRVAGRLSKSELADHYRAADALILPSVGEGFPLVVQEAMGCGLPVFCGLDSAAADPHAQALLHGLEVDPADPAGTADRFAAAIANAPAAPDRRLADHAHATYDWDQSARIIAERLQQLRLGHP